MNANSSKWKKIAATLIIVMLAVTLQAMLLPEAISSPSSPSYSVKAVVPPPPRQLQEGDNVTIWVNVTAGAANSTYVVNINVTNPANSVTKASVPLKTDATEYGNASVVYPTNFTIGAHTNYTGNYHISASYSYNGTVGTAIGTPFFIGLTDATQYKRSQLVKIRATNYQPNELAGVNITMSEITVWYMAVSAVNGVIDTNYTIPADAMPGVYKVTVAKTTSTGTVKIPPDIQNFTVLGSICQIQTRNLANETVANALIQVFNATTNQSLPNLTESTNETGWASFFLDFGNYTFKAYWMNIEVGNLTNQSMVEEKTYFLTMTLRLVQVQIIVEDQTGTKLPFIDLTFNASSNNQTIFNTELETNLTGTVDITNMPTNTSYIIEARRYGFLFYNETTSLPPTYVQAWVNITVVTPTYTMTVQVLDSKNNPAQNLTVAAYEWESGTAEPVQSSTTNSKGNMTLSLAFGKYRIIVYNGTVLLNETQIDLIRNQSSLVIHCNIYKADLNVVVTDYFGHPIRNAVVMVEGQGSSEYVRKTGSNGVASFTNLIGGDSSVSVSVAGQTVGVQSLYIAGSKQVKFKIDGYVAVAGYALETSLFATIIISIIIIVVFILALTYKRIWHVFKKKKTA
jgi:hypothetical protein